MTWFAAQEYTIQSPGTQRSYAISVYTGLDPGTEWIVKGLSNNNIVTPPTVIGHYSLRVTGIPSDYALNYSDRYGSINGYGVTYPSPGNFILHADQVEIHGNATTHIVSVDPGFGNPKLISKYSINISKLKYAYTDFMVKGRSYEVLLSMTYYPLYSLMSYEETTIEVK